MPCATNFLACVGPIVSMCLHAPLPLKFSLVFIYLDPLLNIYFILMLKHNSFPPYSKSQIFHPQPRKLVIFVLGNYLTLSINLTKLSWIWEMWVGNCDPMKNLGHEKSSLPNIACPQAISNMVLMNLLFVWFFEVATEFPEFESLRFHEYLREEPPWLLLQYLD